MASRTAFSVKPTEDQDRLGSNGVDYAANVVLTSTKEHVLGTAHDASRLKNGWRTRADALTGVQQRARHDLSLNGRFEPATLNPVAARLGLRIRRAQSLQRASSKWSAVND